MKGLAEELHWTVIVFAVAIVAFMVLFVFFVVIKIANIFVDKGSPLSYTLRFADVINRPYYIGHVMANFRVEDRNALEHSIEASVTGNLSNSHSENLPLL